MLNLFKWFLFMVKRRLPKSLRKFIRKEKARIRREVFDMKEQEKQIQELYQKNFKKLKLTPTFSSLASDVGEGGKRTNSNENK